MTRLQRRFHSIRSQVIAWCLVSFGAALLVECRTFESADPASSTRNTGSGQSDDATAGSAGDGLVGGTAGTPSGNDSNGGVGAHDSEGGAGGETLGEGDEIITPGCYEPGWHPAVPVIPTTDISIFRSYNGAFHLAIPQSDADLVAVRWQLDQSADSAWDSWACFGVLPSPDRVAAVKLSNGNPAIVASSTDGRFWSRFGFPAWGPWLPMTSAPGKGRITDLDFVVAAGEPNRVYAARSRRLFVRAGSSAEPYAALGPWREIGFLDVEALAACSVGNRTDRVVVATSQREIRTALVNLEETVAPEWTTLEPLEFEVGAAVGCLRQEQGFQVFVSDTAGNIWRSTSPFVDWQLEAAYPGKIRSLDVAEVLGEDPFVVIVNEVGSVLLWRNQSQGWSH